MKQELWSRARNSYSDNPKSLGLSVITFVLALCGAVAEAQQPKKVPRICYLGNTVTTPETTMKTFRERLRELGYIEGQNITIEYRNLEGKVERLPELAAEIVDKILEGTKPADIPVERPKKFDLVINLKAAKQIGFTVPPEVLARASRIIR